MDTIWRPDLSGDSGPKYLCLVRALREAISSGALPEGARLPTVRDLAWQLQITPGTVSRAYQIAIREGILQATVGRGTFVAARQPRLAPRLALMPERNLRGQPGRCDLRSPSLPDLGQAQVLAEALRRIADQVSAEWLDYPTQIQEAPLREAVCDWLADRVLGSFSAQDIMLTHGGQNALGLVMDCCLRGDRPVVLTEELSYPGFRYAARLARAEVVGLEMDGEGVLPETLEAACRRLGPQLLCLTPSGQNPSTARMSQGRMAAIVSIARRYNLQIIEDECYPAVDLSAPSLRALAPDRVWYMGSLSKTISAALRFGYVICPTGMGDAGRQVAQQNFFALSRLTTALVGELFATGQAGRLRTEIMADYAVRLQIVVNALGAHDLSWAAGLPFVWLRLPQGWRASTFAQSAEERGVLIRPADQYAMSTGRAPNAVRLAVAGAMSREDLQRGVQILADLLARPPGDMMV
jgi:DNA-binding transcriptional MocR family regulator